jgi:hypothetical protein
MNLFNISCDKKQYSTQLLIVPQTMNSVNSKNQKHLSHYWLLLMHRRTSLIIINQMGFRDFCHATLYGNVNVFALIGIDNLVSV